MTGTPSDREHRRFSPSQMEWLTACPGAPAFVARLPDREESVYAIEGTKAHDVLNVGLANGVRRALEAHREYSQYCMEDFEREFYYSVQVAMNYVYDILDEYPDAVMWLEQFVDPQMPSAPGEGGGYLDIMIFVPSLRRLWSIDFKHGAGIAKDVVGNPQPTQYAAGALFQDEPLVPLADVDTVTAVIVQPRAFHPDGIVREHDYTPFEIYECMEAADVAVQAALKPDAPLVPGEDQCRFCKGRTVCPAREAMGLQNAVNVDFKNIYSVLQDKIPDPKGLSLDRIGHIMNWKPFLIKFLNDVEDHGLELMRAGHHVPGQKLVEPQARRAWYGDENEIAWQLAALARVDIMDVFNLKLISITDAEKLVVEAFRRNAGRGKKNKAAEDARKLMAQLTLKQSSHNLVAAPETDPRPAVNRAATAFQGVGALIAPPAIE